MTTAALGALRQAHRDDAADEERRLAYVAVTRARHRLLLSSYCWSATRTRPLAVSAFLTDICALGEPVVQVERWCPDPDKGAENPLRAAAADIAWPVSPDAEAARWREQAALAVSAAARTTGGPGTAGPAVAVEHPADDDPLVQAWRDEVELVLADLREAARPTHDVELPRRLTASQVVALARDPDQLARSLARPLPARPTGRARRGSRFHLWLEQRHGGSALFDPEELAGAGDGEQTDAELRELQQAFLASPWAARTPVAVEVPVELVVGGRAVRGRIDAVYDDGSGAVDVIDYKTGTMPTDLVAAGLQLSVYRLAWADLSGLDPAQVRAGFLYVRTGEVVRPPLLDAGELSALLDAPARPDDASPGSAAGQPRRAAPPSPP